MSTASQPAMISVMIADPADRGLLSGFLNALGYAVHLCGPAQLADDCFPGTIIIVDEANARQHVEAILELRQRQTPVYLPVLALVSARVQATPWLRVGFDDVLRMPVGKEELAARLQAFLRLRKYSENARNQSEHFIASTLDALSEHVCVLDSTGTILSVNRAWRQFGIANGLPANGAGPGINYFAVCDAAAEAGSEDAYLFVSGMRAMLAEQRHEFTFEYPCDAPHDKRWFLARVTRFRLNDSMVLVVSHENISTVRRAESELAQLGRFDALTGLPNRAYFYDNLARGLLQARRSKWNMAVLFIDLDRFKAINDTLGHSVGDDVLQQVAKRITACLRGSDMVGRLGGDEFCAYLQAFAHERDAGVVAEKIVAGLSAPLFANGTEVFVTASVGVAVFPNDGETVDALLNAADTAMYWAKNLGRSNYQFFTRHMNDSALERAKIEAGLRRALERNEFALVYQPQTDLRTGRICGCEALIRWNHPERGMVSPADFIPIAEDTGLIVPIGEWALRTACIQNKAWQLQGLSPIVVAVNLSARQLKRNELPQIVQRALLESGLDGQFLELELTESIVLEDVDHHIRIMHELKALGARLSIDDFGTGYSNLGYLSSFPLDTIKIDRSFVNGIGNADAVDNGMIANMILSLGHNLKLTVIAEGVETEEQLKFLSDAGCDMAQGYLLARPLPPDELSRLMACEKESRRAV